MSKIKWWITQSETGAIKVGTDAFYVLVQNGFTDGKAHVTHVGIADGPTDTNDYVQVTVVKGDLFIFNNGKEILAHLSGRYGVYVQTRGEDAHIIFEKWNSL